MPNSRIGLYRDKYLRWTETSAIGAVVNHSLDFIISAACFRLVYEALRFILPPGTLWSDGIEFIEGFTSNVIIALLSLEIVVVLGRRVWKTLWGNDSSSTLLSIAL